MESELQRLRRGLLIMSVLFAVAIAAVIYLYVSLAGEPGRVKAAVDREITHRSEIRDGQFCALLGSVPRTRLTQVVRVKLGCNAASAPDPEPRKTRPAAVNVPAPHSTTVVIRPTSEPTLRPHPTVTRTTSRPSRSPSPTPRPHPSPTPAPVETCLKHILHLKACTAGPVLGR